MMVAISLLACLGAGAAAFLGYMAYDYITRPGSEGPVVRINVPQGENIRGIGEILAKHDLIEHEFFFRAAVRLDDSGRPIQHGAYDLPRGLSPMELLHRMQEGPTVAGAAFKITVAEGQTLEQTGRQFDDPTAFIAAASDPGLIAELGVAGPTLEGFLMPDTYFFDERPTPQELVQKMVDRFIEVYADLLEEFPEGTSRDKREVVTVASLIEEEAKADEERGLVAAVIYNRLERKMTLDLDSTLQFALNKYGQRLLDSDKETDSPYNTYRYAGLPPGPISSPGRAALRAALRPADKDYLYFVSNADGKTHTFSVTFAEHNNAVAKFRREIAVQRTQESKNAQTQQ
jgi:UPF0755 protein